MIGIFAAAAARAHGMVARGISAFLMAALVLIGSAGATLAADGCTPYNTSRFIGSGTTGVEITIRGDFLEGDFLAFQTYWTGHGGSSTLTATAYTTNDVQIVTASKGTSGTTNGGTSIGLTLPADYTDLKLKISDPKASGFSADLVCKHAIPVVTGISPSTGPVSGGNTVTITGSYFNNVTAVKFGANVATSFAADSTTQITATVPAGAAGTSNIVVTSATAGNSAARPYYTYQGPPTVSAVSPINGTTAGGTTVTITGTSLTDATVTLGGAPITLTSNTATSIIFTTPAHAEGAAGLVVTTSGGTVTRSFTFVEPIQAPVITSPVDSELVDSKRPTITGTARAGSTVKVYVDNALVDTVTAGDDGDWTVTVPASLAQGLHSVSVTATDSWNNVSPAATIQIAVPASNDAKLSGLAVGGAALTPSFSSSTTAYTASVPYATTSVAVTPQVSDNGASVTVNGTIVASGTASGAMPLDVGANTITVMVTAEDGQTLETYAVTVTRAAPSDNAALSALTISGATLAPGFSADVTGYSASVPYATTSLTVTPDAADVGSTITVNGTPLSSGATSSAIPLNVGSNTITVVVTAQDGLATKTYTVDVERGEPPSTDAQLSDLTVSGVSLSPTFSSGTTSYSASVANAVTSISVLPTASDAGATVTVNGTTVVSGTASGSIPLAVGANTITVVVTAEDGQTTGTYTVAVERAPSDNAALSALTIGGATVAPGFSPDVTGYSASVPYATTFLTVTPDAADVGSTITVNGTPLSSGATSSAIPLNVGSNTITVVVTAQDGLATKTYTVDVERGEPPSTDAQLSGLTVSGVSLSPTFSSGTTSYSASVANAVTSISVLPTASDAGATITVNGTAVVSGTASGSIPLAVGANTITVVVTAEDGTTSETYTVAVDRASIEFVFSPQVGSLPDAMADEEYHQAISASGGTAPLIYSLISGALPDGMVLNLSTGELNGPLAANTEGDYSFTIQVRDTAGNVGSASYTVKVVARTVSVADKEVDVPAGSTPPNVYLNAGATGGPFIQGELVSVSPSNAGTAELILGEVAALGPVTPRGFYLKFTPDPAFSGQVRVGYRLISDLGNSNVGTVTYNLNFNGTVVASDIDKLVHGFVETRQNLLASSIKLPGLLDRRRMSSDPVTTRLSPSTDGLALNFATSLAQMEAARNAAQGLDPSHASAFNLWIDGTFVAHNREENGGRWGTFGLFSAGADYLINENFLIGLSAHVDHMTDPTDADAKLKGTGWLVGPYGSIEIGKGVFFDTSLLYGGSSNDIDTSFFGGKFTTRRWMWDSSITGQLNLDDMTVLTPRLRAVYLNEAVDDYRVDNGTGGTLELDGFTAEQFRISLGVELQRRFVLESGLSLTPKIGLAGGFAGLDGSGAFGSMATGLSLSNGDSWTLDTDLLLNFEGDGQTSAGAKLGLSARF